MAAAETKPRRLIVTAREARALREGATQVRRPFRITHADLAHMYPAPLVAGGVYWIAEPHVVDYFPDKALTGSRHGYAADWTGAAADVIPEPRWRSAATMPRWASRMSVVVESVRVERVQDATEEDARAMGARPLPLQEGEPGCWFSTNATTPGMHARDAIGAMRKAWDAEHPRSPWAANPWVAVGAVRRVNA